MVPWILAVRAEDAELAHTLPHTRIAPIITLCPEGLGERRGEPTYNMPPLPAILRARCPGANSLLLGRIQNGRDDSSEPTVQSSPQRTFHRQVCMCLETACLCGSHPPLRTSDMGAGKALCSPEHTFRKSSTLGTFWHNSTKALALVLSPPPAPPSLDLMAF